MPDPEQLDDFLEVLETAGSPANNTALRQALRGLFGTSHGQHGSTTGLTTRHAKLAVGAASTLAVFFETHEQTK